MEFLHNLLQSSGTPWVTALVLGLMTAISPCPLATNITAIGFIGKDIHSRKQVFYNGIIYTLGRGISYTSLGLLFYFGVDQALFSGFLQTWGEMMLGPFLIVTGLFMLGIFTLNITLFTSLREKIERKEKQNFWSVLLLGILFALAFCPYSGVLFFGMLIPITLQSASGLALPLIFAIATGIPVIIFAWLIAYSVGSIGNVYNSIKIFEQWFRKALAVLFLGIGVYQTSVYFF